MRYYRDTYAEHPEDRKNIEYSVHLDNDEDLVTLSGLYEQIKHLDEAFKLGYARWVILLSEYDEIFFFSGSEKRGSEWPSGKGELLKNIL